MTRLQSFDHIIALDENGTVLEQGSFESLKSHQEYFKIILSLPDKTKSTDEKPLATSKSVATVPITGLKESKDTDRQTGDWTVYKYYLKSTGWFNAVLTLSMSMVNAFCVVYSSKWFAELLSDSFLTWLQLFGFKSGHKAIAMIPVEYWISIQSCMLF